MNLLLIAAATTLDGTASSVLSLIGSLGSAGAAVVVVWMFISFLKSEGDKRDQRYEELVTRCLDVIKDNAESNREFVRSINTICRSPNR